MHDRLEALRQRAVFAWEIVRSTSGPRGAIQGIRVASVRRSGGTIHEPVPVRMRAMNGGELFVRPGTSDLMNAVAYYSTGAYLAPPEIANEPLEAICELGTNIGAALAALGTRYPEARLLGVEADPGNAAIARRNLSRFADRADIVQTAVWDTAAELTVDRTSEHGEHGFKVREATASDPGPRITARTIDDILDERLPGESIDYMHMTVEGSEPRILSSGGSWPERVRSLRVELHPYFGFGAAECVSLLESLGYRAWLAPSPPDKWVFALRR